MANFFEVKNRTVIPNFRSFKKAVETGELHSSSKEAVLSAALNLQYIEELKLDWNSNKSIGLASDLLSNALVCNFKDPIIKEISQFLLSHSKKITKSQKCLATKLIGETNCLNNTNGLNLNKLEFFLERNNLPVVFKQIGQLKKYIRSFGLNPLAYVELSRLYSIIGQERQSIKNMEIALHLSSSSRYVLRSAARLFAHFEDIDYAHELLRRNDAVKHDPWILAAEIALASIRGRNSRFIKKGLNIVNTKSIAPIHFSELSSAIATIELENGNRKKSKNLFLLSLIDPTSNSLAQFEWANFKENLFDLGDSDNIDEKFYEAKALSAYHKDEWQKSILNAEDWFIETPFSKRPILLGSHIASTFLDDHKLSINFCKAGLISHPNDPQLLNNMAYSLAINDQTEEANKKIEIALNQTDIERSTLICLKATQGLSLFRDGNEEAGRLLYLNAIEEAKNEKLNYFNWLAILNYAREEILVKSDYIEAAMDVVAKMPKKKNSEIEHIRKSVIELYKLYKESL